MRWIALSGILLSGIAVAQEKQTPAPKPRDVSEMPAWEKSKYIRPGWRLVDGGWVKPQAKVALSELFSVVTENDTHILQARPATRIEPMLRNWRTSVVELEGSDYAWKMSCAGRQWDAFRSEATQHLQLVAVTDDALADTKLRLTLVRVTPHQSIIQAAVIDPDKQPRSILLMLSRDTVELAVAPLGEARTDLIFRARTTRELLRDHPDEARAYLVPMLQRLAGGTSLLEPAAGDVYRVFSDLQPDPLVLETVRKIIPDLSNRDPKVRDRASRELASLKRQGVLAAMRIDRDSLPPEAADRLAGLITTHTHDPRTPEQLLGDDVFLTDCLADPDPRVRTRAKQLLGR